MMAALGTVFLLIGAFFEVLDLAMGSLSSIIMIFVYIEIGSPYTWLVWLTTSLCTFLLGSQNPMAALWYFTLFGIWPILKGYVERLPRVVWLVPKLVFANVAFAAVFGLYWLIFRISPFMFDNEWIALGIWALGNFAFIIYDMFVTAMAKVYLLKYRKRFSRLLK